MKVHQISASWHMRLAARLMSPIYIEHVRWLKAKQDRHNLPVKVARRDGELIHFVSRQMAKIEPADFAACNEWELVWLNRHLVYPLGAPYEEREMRYFENWSRGLYNGSRHLMENEYLPRVGINKDSTFIFSDTGGYGRMSMILSQLGFANIPAPMVHFGKYYSVDSFCDVCNLELVKTKAPADVIRDFPSVLINITDSAPKKTMTAFCYTKENGVWEPWGFPKPKEERLLRKEFYAGLREGVAACMKNRDPSPEKNLRWAMGAVLKSYSYVCEVLGRNTQPESHNLEHLENKEPWPDEKLSHEGQRLMSFWKNSWGSVR